MQSTDTQAFLICRVAGRRLALPSEEVAEVLPLLPLWRPPTLPRPLAGFVSVRGEVLPVLALDALFGARDHAVDAFAHIIRPRGDMAPCLLVERVEQVAALPQDAIRPIAPDASLNGAIVAELLVEDGIAHLLSLGRLLSEAEQTRTAALTQEAQRRAAEWA